MKNFTVEEWLNNSKIGIDIWNNKYKHGDETFEEWLDRVSNGNEELKKLIIDKKFLFGGRILANRGLAKDGKKITYSNCYVVAPPEDNLESIYETCKRLARTYSYGGGVGVDISKLAPAGAKVNNAAETTSGAVSFMDTFSQVTEQIGQHGRRGALMISIDCTHPDLEAFIDIKTDLNKVNKANTSVRVSDDFMEAVKNDENVTLKFERPESGQIIKKTVKAKQLFNKLAKNNWDFAEPGCLFWDNINDNNLMSNNKNFSYAGTNPCLTGDVLIQTINGIKPIKDLENQKIKVMVYDPETGKKSWSINEPKIVKTKVVNTLYRMTLSDNTVIKGTPEHKFLLKDGSYKELKDITVKDELEQAGKQITIVSVEKLNSPDTPVFDVVNSLPYNNFIVCGEKCTIVSHNCAEEPLPEWGSCNLGSINLSEFVKDKEFDYEDFKHTVRIAIRGLNEVLDEGEKLHPLKEQQECVKKWKQTGLGIMGLADMLIKMEIEYDSIQAINLCDEIGKIMAETAMQESVELAKEKGCFEACTEEVRNGIIKTKFFENNHSEDNKQLAKDIKEYGLRNSQLLTIAPTGTLSTMLGISGGIEPIYEFSYTRKTESLKGHDEYYKVFTPIVDAYMKENKIKKEEDLPEFFVNAHTINYKDRIEMQSVWQKHIDASISSTVNLKEETTVDEVFDLYCLAWEKGLKGITIFRDNCKRVGILTKEGPKKEEEEPICPGPKRGEVIPCSNNVVGLKKKITTGCGSLHIMAYFDPETKALQEVYLSKGSTGGCANFMNGLSRFISLACRAGVKIEDIKDQLDSCGTCPSYASRRAVQKDTSKGSSCPVAIGYALMEMYKEFKKVYKEKETKEEVIATAKENAQEKKINEQELIDKGLCPKCGEPMVRINGCITCKSCGWSKCD